MAMGSAPLPSFEQPPVHEVAMSLVFAPLRALECRHFGALWHGFKEKYPIYSEHPPIQSQLEQFGVPGKQQIRLELLQRPELPRAWFVAENDMELVQVQNDRFVRNWRKRGDKEYPRFGTLLNGLESDWARFTGLLAAEGFPEPELIQCELDYVNHIDVNGGFTSFNDSGAWFHPLSSGFSDGYLAGREVDDVSARFSFPMKANANDTQPIGRLRVAVESRVTVSDTPKPLLRLTLSARGRPIGEGWEGAKAFFEIGREWIVRGFKSATTDHAHKKWGGPTWDQTKQPHAIGAAAKPKERKDSDV